MVVEQKALVSSMRQSGRRRMTAPLRSLSTIVKHGHTERRLALSSQEKP
jgi:hypothetical protein